MEYRTLGTTGITVSRLCFGSLTVGPLQADLPPRRSGEIISYALSQGINFIDTAQYYQNYPHIRAGLAQTERSDTVITSKTYAHTSDLAEIAVEEARRQLDRDVIDIFLLHEQESEHTLRGHNAALERLYRYKAAGTIRAVGISTHHVAGAYAAAVARLDVLHPLYNRAGIGIADGRAEDMLAAISAAKEAGVGIYGMKALAGGNLLSSAEASLKHCIDQPVLDSIAVGMQSEDEIDANIELFKTGAISPDRRLRLGNTNRRLHIEPWCTGCGSCAARCGNGALRIEGRRAVCDDARCALCGYCGGACRVFAIKIV